MFQIYEVSALENQALEPMGSKAKFWFEHEELGPCLYKEARPETGEDWSEKVAAEIAELLSLPHARYELAVSEGASGVITPRITRDDEELVHGNELLREIDQEYGSNSAQYRTPAHTVSAVVQALRQVGDGAELPVGWDLSEAVEDAVDLFAGYLFLDAIIGNTDRHHENWALIRGSSPGHDRRYRVAPTFDHASSLGRNEPLTRIEERLATKDQGYTVEAYAKRARSALFSSADDTAPLRPVEAFREVTALAPDASRAWCARLGLVTEQAVRDILQQIPDERMASPVKEFVVRMVIFNCGELTEVCETS